MYLNVKNGLAIIQMIENETIDKKDFIRTESYTLRLRPLGAKKVTQSVNSWLNKTVEYQGKEISWNYVIFLKVREMAHYFIGKTRSFTFLTPKFTLNRQDSDIIRQKIANISYANWKKMGFSKGTLHYMKKKADGGRPFSLNKHVKVRLDTVIF
jgi:CRISPR-associated protein Cas1